MRSITAQLRSSASIREVRKRLVVLLPNVGLTGVVARPVSIKRFSETVMPAGMPGRQPEMV